MSGLTWISYDSNSTLNASNYNESTIPGIYTIYHFALEHEVYCMNYGIYADGLY